MCPGRERGGFKPESLSAAGRLCPRVRPACSSPRAAPGSTVLYRRPHGTDWETLDLDTAMDMIADRVLDARRRGWQQEVDGHRTRRSQPGQGCHLPGTHSFWSPLTVTAGLAIRSHTRPVARGNGQLAGDENDQNT